MKFFSTGQEENTFVAKIKLSRYYGYRDKLISIINKYLLECYGEINYKIEYESSNTLILNFHQHTDMANCVSRYVKIMKLEYIEFSKLVCNLNIKIINSYNLFLSKKKKPKKLNPVQLPGIYQNADESLKKIIIPPKNIIQKSFIKKLPSISKSVDYTKNNPFGYNDLTGRDKKIENKVTANEKDSYNLIQANDEKLEIQPYNQKREIHIRKNSWLIQSRLEQNNTETNVLQKSKFEKEFADKTMSNIENEKNYDKEDDKNDKKEDSNGNNNKNNENIKIKEDYNN